ncbi:CHASE2 domain-containing protein [Pseudodesulfovibrio sp.]|uniref:CHASE2 domain-containing protein n=1 Tax=unclassified Pseudodesulfovibrio TaxID=2661612 RepID=UPI003AFFFA8F
MINFIKKKFKKDQVILLATGMAATVLMVILFAARPSFFSFLDYKIYDQFVQSYHESNATDIPVVIDLDEKSLRELGQWPWPRYRVAMLLKYLQAYGASAVATDIIFVEPDRTSPDILRQQLKKEMKVDIQINNLPPALADNDLLLAQNLKTGPFVLGFDFQTTEIQKDKSAPHGTTDCFIRPLGVTVLTSEGAPSPHDVLYKATDAVCPLPILATAVRHTGFITIAPDKDSVYRRVPLLFSWNDKFYPSLALATIMQATGLKSPVIKMGVDGVESFRLGKTVIPVDGRGRMLINYRGPMKTFRYISAVDVLNRKLKPEELRGKICFIGASASGLKDIRATPLDPGYPGVEAHCTIVDNILSGQFISSPSWARQLELFTMLCVGLITTLLLIWTRAAWLILPMIGLGWGMWFGSVKMFTVKHYYISPLYPYFDLALTFILLTVIKFWREEHAKKFIHGAFAHYLAPSVISQIMDNPDALSLEGQEKEITIQFSDIRSFTSLSEKLSPTQVTNLLHDYLTPMTRTITEHQGTLDKFIGDAVMAFWNAPLDVEHHQAKALDAALAQLAKLDELNTTFLNKYGFTIAIGIGVHSGSVRVGNMGSADLFDYTLIGDNVNLASRLEGLTKFYGQTLVVSQAIVDACGDEYRFRILDRVRVKGKVEPVTIYTAYTLEQAASREAELKQYDLAHDLYLQQEFHQAKMLFEELDKLGTETKLYALYIERCDQLLTTPPEGEWDGVFTHKTK